MTDTGEKIRASSINRALMLLGDWWSMLLVREAFLGVRKFEQFHQKLGVPRQTLIKRLREMTANEIFYRSPYQKSPLRHEYRLTAKGLDLYACVLMIWRWQKKWGSQAQNELPGKLIHKTCGHPTNPLFTCAHCKGEVALRDVHYEDGPGAVLERKAPARIKRWSPSRRHLPKEDGNPREHSAYIMADRWAHLILVTIYLGCRHFDSIQRELQIAPNILAHRLVILTDSGLLTKIQAEDDARRYVYRITDRGRDIFPISLSLLKWADRWLAGPAGAPIIRFHRTCGAVLDAQVTCSACHGELLPRDVTFATQDAPVQHSVAI